VRLVSNSSVPAAPEAKARDVVQGAGKTRSSGHHNSTPFLPDSLPKGMRLACVADEHGTYEVHRIGQADGEIEQGELRIFDHTDCTFDNVAG